METSIIKITLEVPEEICQAAREAAESQAREAAVLALWQAGEISTRVAASELSLGYHDFLDLLAARGIPVERGELNLAAIEAASKQVASVRP
jgi:predicted HTH domain antitoxin